MKLWLFGFVLGILIFSSCVAVVNAVTEPFDPYRAAEERIPRWNR